MTAAELHPAIREALGAHECFRRIGFTPDQIFVGLQEGVLFTAVVRGGRQFAVTSGPCALDLEALLPQWRAACAWWNASSSSDERHEIFEGSKMRRGAVNVLIQMIDAGFAVKPADA